MAENRSHSESFEQRKQRFSAGTPVEIIDTLLNSISNFFNNEIRLTVEEDQYQSSLMFMGVHAVALTISEGLYGKSGLEGFTLFLEKYVDGEENDKKFSIIAESIHTWRNVLAHQWLGAAGHTIGYNYNMSEGWRKDSDVLFINPRIYCQQYLAAFGPGGRVWNWSEDIADDAAEAAKQRLLGKFLKR